MLHHDLPFDEITDKKPVAFAYIDDRGITFKDWNQALKDLTALWSHDHAEREAWGRAETKGTDKKHG